MKTAGKILSAALAAAMAGLMMPTAAMASTAVTAKGAAKQMAQNQKQTVEDLLANCYPFDLSADIGIDETAAAKGTYPEAFDLRACSPDLDGDGYLEPNGHTSYVTSVKNQNPWGTCWSFATMAASETSYLSATMTPAQDANGKDAVNFSEKQLDYFLYTPLTKTSTSGQAGEGRHYDGGSIFNAGGQTVDQFNLITSGVGPTQESANIQYEYRGFITDTSGKKTTESSLTVNWSLARGASCKAKLVAPNGEAHTVAEWKDVEGHPDWAEYYKQFSGDMIADGSWMSYRDNPENWKGLTSDMTCRKSTSDDWSLDENLRFHSSLQTVEAVVLPSTGTSNDLGGYRLSEDAMNVYKSELQQGRAIAVSYNYDDQYFNEETSSQYAYEYASANHAVTIVGWDDNYSAENFKSQAYVLDEDGDICYNKDGSVKTKEVEQPPADGAWIVKNSWGALSSTGDDAGEWGDSGEGYFYMSYFDQSIANSTTYKFNNKLTSGASLGTVAVGQYDYANESAILSLDSDAKLSSASVFTASKRTKVSAVSCMTASASNKVTLQLYKLNKGATKPTDGKLLKTVTKTFDYAGFHKVSLGKSYTMAKGTKYAVVVTALSSDNLYEVAYTADYTKRLASFVQSAGIDYPYYATTVVNKGESFLISKGKVYDWAKVVAYFNKIGKESYGGPLECIDNLPVRAFGSYK